jgi:excisionase family DNA binding protein
MAGAVEAAEIMTVRELAEYLKLDPNTIYRKFRSGEIPGVKIGKAVRFKRDVVDAWLRRMSWAWGPEKRAGLRRWAEDFARQNGIREEDVEAAIARRRAG